MFGKTACNISKLMTKNIFSHFSIYLNTVDLIVDLIKESQPNLFVQNHFHKLHTNLSITKLKSLSRQKKKQKRIWWHIRPTYHVYFQYNSIIELGHVQILIVYGIWVNINLLASTLYIRTRTIFRREWELGRGVPYAIKYHQLFLFNFTFWIGFFFFIIFTNLDIK